jgi:hypothetical protein
MLLKNFMTPISSVVPRHTMGGNRMIRSSWIDRTFWMASIISYLHEGRKIERIL